MTQPNNIDAILSEQLRRDAQAFDQAAPATLRQEIMAAIEHQPVVRHRPRRLALLAAAAAFLVLGGISASVVGSFGPQAMANMNYSADVAEAPSLLGSLAAEVESFTVKTYEHEMKLMIADAKQLTTHVLKPAPFF